MSIRQLFGGIVYEGKLRNRDHSYTGDMGYKQYILQYEILEHDCVFMGMIL